MLSVDCYVEGFFFSCIVFIFNASKSFTVNLNKLIFLLLSFPFLCNSLYDIPIFLLMPSLSVATCSPLLLFSLKGFLFASDVPTVLLSTTAQFWWGGHWEAEPTTGGIRWGDWWCGPWAWNHAWWNRSVKRGTSWCFLLSSCYVTMTIMNKKVELLY